MQETLNPKLLAELEIFRADFMEQSGCAPDKLFVSHTMFAPDKLFVSHTMFAEIWDKIPEGQRENITIMGMRLFSYYYIPPTHCVFRSESPYLLKIYQLSHKL